MLFAFGERLRQLRHDKNYTMGMVEDRLAQKNVSIGQSALENMKQAEPIPTWKRLRPWQTYSMSR